MVARFVVVDRGWWQIDGGFYRGLVVSWWLDWFDTAVSGGDSGGVVRGCGSKRGKRGRKEREREMNSEKKNDK